MKVYKPEYLENLYKGKTIQIDFMDGEPEYSGKQGVVQYADCANQLHGTWGGCAVIINHDKFHVVGEA